MLIRNRQWDSPLQIPVQARRLNPLHVYHLNVLDRARGFDSGYAGNHAVFGGVTSGSEASGIRWRIGANGYELLFDNSGTGTIESTVAMLGNSSGDGGPRSNVFTYVVKCKLSSVSVYQALIGGDVGTAQFRVNNTGTLSLLKTFTVSIGTSSTALSIGVDYTLIVTYDGTTAKFYVNGIADGTGTSAQTFAAAQYTIGKELDSNTSYAANGLIIKGIAIFNSVLPISEITMASSATWFQSLYDTSAFLPAYQPADSILVPPYLSNPGVSNITATGAQPVVKVEY